MNKTFKLEFPIAGVPRKIEIKDINIDDIELDPENPRIGYWSDNQVKNEFSQDEVAFALRENSEAVNRLKNSIEINKGIYEPIWVYKKNGKFAVIDGNTRVLIYRELREKYPQDPIWNEIKCKILPKNIDETAKNFIRLIAHLRGVNDWEVYERARMLYILWDKRGYSEEDLRNTTKLSTNQIKRWIKAYKDMTEQFLPKYGNQSDSLNKFSYFVEFNTPKITQGMEENNLTIKDFCDWVGKKDIKHAQDVRNLKLIFSEKHLAEILVKKGYKYAIEQLSVEKPQYSSPFFESVEDVISGLKDMTRYEEEEIKEESPRKMELLKTLLGELKKFFGEK
jgi:hypothetical protein